MTISLSYDPQLSRVRISADGLPPEPVTVERSTDQMQWTTVRGGAGISPVNGEILLDDYEFAADIENWYRVAGQTASITPVLDGVWLKSIARPFLNRPLPRVLDVSPIQRQSRSGVFEIVGRSLPIVVSSVRGSRRWTLTVLTEGQSDAEALNLLLASGDPLFLQVPPGLNIPGGYVTVEDTAEQRYPDMRDPREPCVFTLPFIECAPPGPDVVPALQTWDSLSGALDWDSEVITQYATWDELAELVGDPGEVIVP